VTFRALSDRYSLEFADATLRGVDNRDLTVELGSYESRPEIPTVFRLVGNTPNPSTPKTSIAYNVLHESQVSIVVYDVSGRRVATLVDGVVEPGRHYVTWDGRNDSGESVGSGVYFCTMEAPEFHDNHKMMLLK
jgi:hypothetical protein